MLNILKEQCRFYLTKFSFGSTSAIITNLALITGLDTLTHPKGSIIGGILVIALADNIADSVGIHIYQESECMSDKEAWLSTSTNFLARLLTSLIFVILVIAFPIKLAAACSVVWGLALLAVLSYVIAKEREVPPYLVIFEHLGIAVLVIILSHFVGKLIITRFHQ
jgi:VIT1/CCC1 family predicted Fe2+/Mn2+ transporter